MACTANKAPFLRAITKRGLSAVACPRPVGTVADVQSNVLNNKVVVAAADGALPVSRVSVVFRAGSRNETYDTQGAAHLLRIATGLTTQNSSGFAITRHLQQVGGSLTCTTDREIVAYTIETTANNLETGLRYLQDVIQPAFKPWELADSVARIKYHVAAVPHHVRAVELLHKAAFRHNLGNSLYIPKRQIGKLSNETLMHYVANNFTANRCAVVGVGIDYNTLSGFAQSLELQSGSGKENSASYYGGDARKDKAGDIAHVAVGGSGGTIVNQKEALAFAVLERAVANKATSRGALSGSFGKALASAVGNSPANLSVINANYSDAGLFGFVVSADSQVVGKAVEAVTKVLKSGAISADDVNRGKALLKTAVLDAYGTDGALISEMGVQAALTKQVTSADCLVSAIDALSQQDVQEAARKAGSSKLSVGAIGNLANVPYASDLA